MPVDLKVGPFEDRYVGQMNKYVDDYRERVPPYPWERPTIGLIICASTGREEVRYALGGLEGRIFVAEYRRKLPSEVAIGAHLGRVARASRAARPTLDKPEGGDRGLSHHRYAAIQVRDHRHAGWPARADLAMSIGVFVNDPRL